MKLGAILLGSFFLAGSGFCGEWYEELSLGITRVEISKLGGPPSSFSKSTDKYILKQGSLNLKYLDGVLVHGTHFDPGGGAVSRSLYFTWGGDLEASHIQERRDFLKAGKFMVLPKFKGPRIRASNYRGICYALDEGYLVVEPMIGMMGGSGHFLDKTEKVTLIDSEGESKVIYEAIHHWKNLKPPNLRWSEVMARSAKLKSLGENPSGKSIVEAFGFGDSRMGSGMDFRLFYLQERLLVVPMGFDDVFFRGEASEIFPDSPRIKEHPAEEWMNKVQFEGLFEKE